MRRIESKIKSNENKIQGEAKSNDRYPTCKGTAPATQILFLQDRSDRNRIEPARNSWGFAETFRTAMHATLA